MYPNTVSIILLSPRYALSHFSRSSTVVLLVYCEALQPALLCYSATPIVPALRPSYVKDFALPGLQRNMEREMMMNVRSKEMEA